MIQGKVFPGQVSLPFSTRAGLNRTDDPLSNRAEELSDPARKDETSTVPGSALWMDSLHRSCLHVGGTESIGTLPPE